MHHHKANTYLGFREMYVRLYPSIFFVYTKNTFDYDRLSVHTFESGSRISSVNLAEYPQKT